MTCDGGSYMYPPQSYSIAPTASGKHQRTTETTDFSKVTLWVGWYPQDIIYFTFLLVIQGSV